MSSPLIREDAAEQQHPIAPMLRMDRMPHIWCPTCGIGTVVKCYASADEPPHVELVVEMLDEPKPEVSP